MKYFRGALSGVLGGLVLLSFAGAAFGALFPPSCCGVTADRLSGAIFGVVGFGYYLGLPTAAAGSVVGTVASCFWRVHGNLSSGRYARSLPQDQDYWTKPESDQIKRRDG
jgi:hypothetical protein